MSVKNEVIETTENGINEKIVSIGGIKKVLILIKKMFQNIPKGNYTWSGINSFNSVDSIRFTSDTGNDMFIRPESSEGNNFLDNHLYGPNNKSRYRWRLEPNSGTGVRSLMELENTEDAIYKARLTVHGEIFVKDGDRVVGEKTEGFRKKMPIFTGNVDNIRHSGNWIIQGSEPVGAFTTYGTISTYTTGSQNVYFFALDYANRLAVKVYRPHSQPQLTQWTQLGGL